MNVSYLHIFNKVFKLKYFRLLSTNSNSEYDINKLRNIGIFAHIDAGKTTTTERMLFYSGTIKQPGEVHHGNTVTDYMPQEKDRGITIKSAAVTFPWRNHQFNLIDTPGHIDFTMEVEQTLNVLDGGIIVLDGSAGVEAQTLTVWRQADRYKLPRIIYVNKMDRAASDLAMCCKSIRQKLQCDVFCMQLPIRENNKFVGIVDILSQHKRIWHTDDKTQTIKNEVLKESDGDLFLVSREARNLLIDHVSEFDDNLANLIIESGSMENIKTTDIVTAIAKCVLEQKAVPVFCGSAYKNIAVEPLMDAVILYLPAPNERNKHFSSFGDKLCARAFKILHDKQKGPLVFFRIYSGAMTKGQKLYNIQGEVSEQGNKLWIATADAFREVEVVNNGNVAVMTGLKQTMTGNLVTNTASAAQNAKQRMEHSNLKQEEINAIFNVGAKVPEPVFFCSIEPPSLAQQSALEVALEELQREDPSLRVDHHQRDQLVETGQTVLAGMGELHLEIIKDRLLKEYKIDADLGPLQISYKESPITRVKYELHTDRKIGNSNQKVSVNLSLIPTDNNDGKIFVMDKTPEAASQLASVFQKHLAAVKNGVEFGLTHGPKLGCQIINAQVMLHSLVVGKGTSDSMIAATTTHCIHKLLEESGTIISEPIMRLEIVAPEEYLSSILGDLSRRRANVQSFGIRGNNKMVVCEVPLSEIVGYSTLLRTISSGTGTFSMEFIEYRPMSNMHEDKAIKQVRGF